jgi:maltooligosyltrehalose trehalohydrolase
MTSFTVWAPTAHRVALDLSGRRLPLDATAGGWWAIEVADAGPGTDYAYVIDGADPVPDPRSRWQPHGVHGPSRVYDHDAYRWSDQRWPGRALSGSVIYEMHVGTFTDEGTFDAAIDRLAHLVDLGVDHVEIMPVASFPGRNGWGYDGVHLWAVHDPYGGPDAFKRFIDACHAHGLGVVLDVVYNHLGPSGNYLSAFGPYFTDKHHTPWGAAVNLDDAGSDEVRRWVIDNALMWLRDYHLDGLRLDAVHALVDERATHVLEQLSEEVDALAAAVNRPLFLVAESDLNDPKVVTAREAGGWGVHAQWNDDFHHGVHALLTGERQGYYGDFGSLSTLVKALTEVFVHDGAWSSFRGRHHGRPVDRFRLPGSRFLAYLNDHDQTGNRALGDRIVGNLSPGLQAVGAALVLTSPFTPMLFMGDEWGASTPWQFFTDHQEPELAEAIRAGRRHEFAEHGWDAEAVPDPQDPATVARSTLRWDERDKSPHEQILGWHRDLLALRRRTPELTDPRLDRVRVDFDEDARWLLVHRGAVRVVCNIGATGRSVPLGADISEVLFASDPEHTQASAKTARLAPESVAILRCV